MGRMPVEGLVITRDVFYTFSSKSEIVHAVENGMNTVARLLLLACTIVVADAVAGDPNPGEAGQPAAQPSPASAPQSDAPSTAAPSNAAPATPDNFSSEKAGMGTQTGSIAASHATANAQVAANRSGKQLLVDDTVNDAQLKQIVARGYKPVAQARGNQVYYCRSEPELGTRFDKKVCKTATRILQDELDGKDEAARMERPSGNPAAK